MTIDEIVPAPVTDIRPAAAQLQQAVEGILSLPGTATWQQAIARAREGYGELQALMASAEEAFTWDIYYRLDALLTILTPSGGPRVSAKTARDAIKEAMEQWVGACLDKFSAPYLRAFSKLLRHFDRTYRRAKDEQGLLDFNDLLLVTRALLDPASGSDVLEYLRKRFRQVMVDEFQDTNPLQFSLIRALQGDGHLFMVGDVKQAIYRFIGSDVKVFLAQEQHISSMEADGQRITMAVNYRTRREILGALNGLFARLWPAESAGERGGFLFEPLDVGGEFADKASPAIEIACWPEEEGDILTLRDREAQWIARRILQLTGRLGEPALEIGMPPDGVGEPPATRPADYADVVLLFRASTDIPRYEEALRQAGIPYYVVSGRGFYQAREVQDLVHLLRVLDNPLDDFSLAVALRSPLAGISDDTLYWLSRDWSAWTPGEPFPTQTESESQYGRLWNNLLCLAVAADTSKDEQTQFLASSPITAEDQQALATFYHTVQELQAELPAGQPLDLIDLILARTDYASYLLAAEGGEQRYANVQKLREVAADFQARGIFDLNDFQRYLTQLSTLAPREASAPLEVEASQVVRLMTIHAAKGLEAPIVFLADGGREQLRTSTRFLLTAKRLSCQLPTPEGEWKFNGDTQRGAATTRRR